MDMYRAPPAKVGTALESFGFQVFVGIVLAVCLPAMLFPRTGVGVVSNAALWNSVVGALFAVVIGLGLLANSAKTPGTSAFVFVLPSFAISYGIALLCFFGFRLDYGRLYMGGSFATALAAAYLLTFLIERYSNRRFYLVPFGDTASLSSIPGIEWITLTQPVIPADRTAVIVADLRFDHAEEWERMLAMAVVRGHLVYHVKQLGESLTGRISIEHLSESSFGSLLPSRAYVRFKRAIDVVLCLVLFPIVVPVTAAIALAIRLDSPGPVFFIQRRVGYRGREFGMIKFRTMRPRDAAADDVAAREDAITKSDDVRITNVGRLLRRSRLDELPQLLNVLRGEMGVIGPRPEAVALSRWYEAEIPFYVYRHVVRPGITGWAQVRQGHVTNLQDVNEKLHYDFFYIKNLSYWLDILIVLLTFPTMVTGAGSK